MESLPTRKAAERLDIPPRRLHRLAARHQINPVWQGTGRTGEKFWNPADIDRLAELLEVAA